MMRRWMCLALSLLMLAFCASAWAESGEWKYDADYAILRGYEGEGGRCGGSRRAGRLYGGCD